MAEQILDTPIEFLKGVGPKRGEVLQKELGIFTFADLLHHFPFRYVDRSKFHKVRELKIDMPYVQLKGRLTKIKESGAPRKRWLRAELFDGTGSVELVWFRGAKWIKPTLRTDVDYIIFGRPSLFKRKLNIAHPEMEVASDDSVKQESALQPVYPSTEKLASKGLTSRGIEKLQNTLAQKLNGDVKENLSASIIQSRNLMAKREAIRNIHFPKDAKSLQQAEIRLKFEELFYIQLELLQLRQTRNEQIKGFVFEKVGELFNSFYKEQLPFELTEAQKRVIKEIRKDLGSGQQMNRLLQGDVGSGKTIVALLIMLIALDNDYQACIMAPTEILAKQHAEHITQLIEPMGLRVGLLTGSTKTLQRKQLNLLLKSGQLDILIGTHALLEDWVQFEKLGLVIVDEQHRFGVAQRAKLWQKTTQAPHVLVMTATPIPRTLAMTLYGDLHVSTIDELPPGRKPIKTVHRFDSARLKVFGFLKDEIKKGGQVYVVYPLIHESETLDFKDLMDGYESICRAFPRPEYQVAIVHGQMKPSDKDMEMQRFVKGQAQILVSTTVIEVGVDVPNASVMIIESAERFGLSQLHQLRGRVGRGSDQSYCILMTKTELTPEAIRRIETMVKSNDGFEIAEVDLQLRGPGDLLGTQQSGIPILKIADLVKDGQILQLARDVAKELLKIDPLITKTENRAIATQLNDRLKGRTSWARVS